MSRSDLSNEYTRRESGLFFFKDSIADGWRVVDDERSAPRLPFHPRTINGEERRVVVERIKGASERDAHRGESH